MSKDKRKEERKIFEDKVPELIYSAKDFGELWELLN